VSTDIAAAVVEVGDKAKAVSRSRLQDVEKVINEIV
jgi:hypothetical protein